MIFNSLTFLLFLSLVASAFWSLKANNIRLLVILLSSIIFYGFWRVEFVGLLLFSACLDYFIARAIVGKSSIQKKLLLATSLIVNLGLLIVFKYLYFIHENFVILLNVFGITLIPFDVTLILPLGISFYTFQTISYSIDVYRGHLKPEESILAYGCYVLFFPQLIAGPVLRAGEVLPQLNATKTLTSSDFSLGVKRIMYGLFLKIVLADNLAPFVDEGFAIPSELLSAWDVWTLAFLFGFQIYFDFSAYSHIALGAARLFGIKFPENFNFPYVATSPKDFWKRWHISLSSWIRDYLYLPLSGANVNPKSEGGLGSEVNPSTNTKRSSPLFITWSVMGLWHGANWTFLIWGIYHAFIIYIYRMLPDFSKSPIQGGIFRFLTLPIMMLSWIPFRSESLTQTFQLWCHVLNPWSYLAGLSLRENSYLVALTLLCGFYLIYSLRHFLFRGSVINQRWAHKIADVALYTCLVLMIAVFLRPISQFIYFQF